VELSMLEKDKIYRHFIGIEKDEHLATLANTRIRGENTK
jgi:hypothetical protein